MRTTTTPAGLLATTAMALGVALCVGSGMASASPAPAPDGSVNCGPVPAPSGRPDVVSELTPAGRAGCTDAITVMTEYFQRAPNEAEGTARVLEVRGWRCMTDTGAQGSGRTACDQRGLVFHT